MAIGVVDEQYADGWIPSRADEGRDAILKYTEAKAAEALGVRHLAGHLQGGVNVVDQIARDYDGRFLIELMQNSYDAHSPGAEGEIAVHFAADRGETGVLYVANKGKPFDYGDFRAIAELAQSTKPPGQGIGNKGVGFKSVFLISNAPSIYSASSVGGRERFDGFCFRFAEEKDYLALAGHPSAAEVLRQRMHFSALPMPAEEPDEVLMALARRGFTTVTKLPILAAGRDRVETQIEELRSSSVPILLFLDRIRRMWLSVTGTQAVDVVLERQTEALELGTSSRAERVDLGAEGEYLLVRREVPQHEFVAAIERSVEKRLLDPSWLGWSEPVHVAVATRIDAEMDDDRAYCFLPMAQEARSPFHGHINGPFAVPISRKEFLDADVNDLLIEAAAEACAEVSLALRAIRGGRTAVPDLASWRHPHADILQAAFRRFGESLAAAPIVPVLSAIGWESLENSYLWNHPEIRSLSAEAIARARTGPGRRSGPRPGAHGPHRRCPSLGPRNTDDAEWRNHRRVGGCRRTGAAHESGNA